MEAGRELDELLTHRRYSAARDCIRQLADARQRVQREAQVDVLQHGQHRPRTALGLPNDQQLGHKAIQSAFRRVFSMPSQVCAVKRIPTHLKSHKTVHNHSARTVVA